MTSPQGFGFYGPGQAPPAPLPVVRPQVTVRAAAVEGTWLVAVIGRPPAGGSWRVRRITVQGPALSRAYVLVGPRTDTASIVDGTRTGEFDVSEYGAVPLLVLDGAELAVAWVRPDGAAHPAGAAATARVELDELTG